jgi:hypothetical protein
LRRPGNPEGSLISEGCTAINTPMPFSSARRLP